jgi:hypothetical protein
MGKDNKRGEEIEGVSGKEGCMEKYLAMQAPQSDIPAAQA